MAAVIIQQEEQDVRIPAWVRDLASFRRWAKSDDFPERGWYAHLNGELWVDPSMERLRHNRLKGKFGAVLLSLAESSGAGMFLGDRMLLTNVEAELSTDPDGMSVGFDSLRDGKVRLEDGEEAVEVEGAPDMVLEVVSPTSLHKDTVVLRDLYWRAGVKEYWIADSGRGRGEPQAELEFDILRRGPRGYVAARKQGGWIKSGVFGKAFHLTCAKDAMGYPVYDLRVR